MSEAVDSTSAPGRGPFGALGVWGVLNVTPDSFSDGGEHFSPEAAIARGLAMVSQGADIVDVGGESTRPKGKTYGDGFSEVDADEERRRVVPVVRALVEAGVAVSIDTTKRGVAEAALVAGACIVNDVSGGRDEAMASLAAAHGASYVVMHNRGDGAVTRTNAAYEDVVSEVLDALMASAARVEAAGVPREKVWIDPGLGFAKGPEDSLSIHRELPRFVESGYPVLVGASRKSFLGALCQRADGSVPAPRERVGATAASVVHSVMAGAAAVRVHDVETMWQAARVAEALVGQRPAEVPPEVRCR